MAVHAFLTLVCATAVVSADPPAAPAVVDGRDRALAVQAALQRGREHILRGEYGAAVEALEGPLAYIDGNRVYLKLLQDAYRGYVKELRLTHQDTEARKYLQRLLVLDRGAILDSTLGNTAANAVTPPSNALSQGTAPPSPTVRLKSEDDPFQPTRALGTRTPDPTALLTRAEQEFKNRRYREARLLYDQANQSEPGVPEASRDRWAYCKLFCVVEQLNQPAVAGTSLAALEQEVKTALTLAPKLGYGKYLLTEIEKRRGSGSQPGTEAAEVPVRHGGKNADGWQVSETANFRIFHQSPEMAERAARVAEQTRTLMQQKWLGATGAPWNPRCDLYLYPTAADYTRLTGQCNSPGHSTLRLEGGRLVVRRIDLHCDDANLLTAVLPHETTHVVLAGEFGEQLLPRWADEGMAVLTEPRDKVDRHLQNLARSRQERQLYHLQDLVRFDDYPREPRSIGVFYAESVSLVDYLCSLRGPQTFTLFMHDGFRYGYEKALERNYGMRSFAELEQRWEQFALQERPNPTGLVDRSR
jgi:hypothetical protein